MKKSKTKGHFSLRKSPSRNSKDRIYEQMKAALPPDLTPREYTAACQRIARELGI